MEVRYPYMTDLYVFLGAFWESFLTHEVFIILVRVFACVHHVGFGPRHQSVVFAQLWERICDRTNVVLKIPRPRVQRNGYNNIKRQSQINNNTILYAKINSRLRIFLTLFCVYFFKGVTTRCHQNGNPSSMISAIPKT